MLHTPIVCRSPEAIRDDAVTEAHTDICRMLNETCNGRCLYTGKARTALISLRDQCEAFILGEGPYPAHLHLATLAAMRLQQ